MRTVRTCLLLAALGPASPALAQVVEVPSGAVADQPLSGEHASYSEASSYGAPSSYGQPPRRGEHAPSVVDAPAGTQPSGNIGRQLPADEFDGSQASYRSDLMPFRRDDAASEGPQSLPPATDAQPLKLSPPQQRRGVERPDSPTPAGALVTVLGSLGVVLGLFFAVVWFTRRALPKAAASLPTEAVEVLGRTPLSPRQNMHVIRFGRKLLLVSVTAAGAETLAELDNAEEVARISGLCQQNQQGSISQTFRQVLSQFASEPAPGGFLGDRALAESGAASATSAGRGRRSVRTRSG